MDDKIRNRNVKNKLFTAAIIVLTLIPGIPLLLVLFYIFQHGIAAINWDFMVNLPKPVGETGGGVFNAIAGSLMIVSIASVIAIPIGVTIGIFLSEYANLKVSYFVRLSVDVLQGIPSIVIGIVIYLWIVKPLGSFSAISGSVALALMMLPSVIKSSEETLKLIPDTLKEASLALGVPYYKTIMRVIVPTGISGILSGVIIGIARIAGETAPLLFTAFGNPFTTFNIAKPMSSLPLIIFNYAISPYKDWQQLAWGASFILISIILFLNIITKIVERRWKVQF